jgi:hypothetical protein
MNDLPCTPSSTLETFRRGGYRGCQEEGLIKTALRHVRRLSYTEEAGWKSGLATFRRLQSLACQVRCHVRDRIGVLRHQAVDERGSSAVAGVGYRLGRDPVDCHQIGSIYGDRWHRSRFDLSATRRARAPFCSTASFNDFCRNREASERPDEKRSAIFRLLPDDAASFRAAATSSTDETCDEIFGLTASRTTREKTSGPTASPGERSTAIPVMAASRPARGPDWADAASAKIACRQAIIRAKRLRSFWFEMSAVPRLMETGSVLDGVMFGIGEGAVVCNVPCRPLGDCPRRNRVQSMSASA